METASTEKQENPQSPKKLQAVSIEELNDLKEQLVKNFSDKEKRNETNTLKILKVLATKDITLDLLKESKVGKVLSSITNSKGEIEEKSLLKEAEDLLAGWKKVADVEKLKLKR